VSLIALVERERESIRIRRASIMDQCVIVDGLIGECRRDRTMLRLSSSAKHGFMMMFQKIYTNIREEREPSDSVAYSILGAHHNPSVTGK